MLATCLRVTRLDPVLRQVLEDTARALRTRPPRTFLEHLAELRDAVLVPIPSLLADRYLGPRPPRRRRRPPSATPFCFSAATAGA